MLSAFFSRFVLFIQPAQAYLALLLRRRIHKLRLWQARRHATHKVAQSRKNAALEYIKDLNQCVEFKLYFFRKHLNPEVLKKINTYKRRSLQKKDVDGMAELARVLYSRSLETIELQFLALTSHQKNRRKNRQRN